jgi:hypothetical protein
MVVRWSSVDAMGLGDPRPFEVDGQVGVLRFSGRRQVAINRTMVFRDQSSPVLDLLRCFCDAVDTAGPASIKWMQRHGRWSHN